MMRRICFVSFILFVGVMVAAQPIHEVGQSNESPYHSILSHLHFLQPDTYQPENTRICMPTKLDSTRAVDLAIQIKNILDAKGLYVYLNKIPKNPNYQDSLTDSHTYTLFPNDLPELYLEKTDDGWIYAPESLDAIPKLMRKVFPYGTHYLVKRLPIKGGNQFLSLAAWQYLGILILIILAALVYFIFNLIFQRLISLVAKTKFKNWSIDSKESWSLARLVSLLVIFRLIYTFYPVLQLPVRASYAVSIILKIFSAIFFMVLAMRIVTIIMNRFKSLAEITENRMDDQILPIASKLLKILIAFLAIIYILNILHVNVTAVIAGVSIGGLALALAAQDTVKNLIGSMMIFIDRPFQIGDYIEVDGKAGSVEEVGFRSTRIRTVDTSVIAIPNGSIANISVNNLGIRPRRLFNTTIGVTYDTPADFLEAYVLGIRELILSHPRFAPEPVYVHLNSFGNSSINIMVRGYIETNVYAEELALKEEMYLDIMRLAQHLGIRFAFPSQTLYVEDFPGQKSLIPTYGENRENLNAKTRDFIDRKYAEGSSDEDHENP